ncbi:cytochrome c-type biogenesis protein CcmE [Halomonas cupida]|uniref:Cytochrome c-type biogenesis protein CcmE n=1 Tax=Halomonas cupida TaxID=44933 RepID=A0A1M7FA22_9GAMM|nr:cytochrome c maturation protein CcmE [Halomonas cupida]GEN23459.1 cytochrome c-type biogenesis protein CcmE [Halomonas cupida]SHM00608.1 cytochrome c-type biogenesis protein CcmE [Halomonas cupida]
MRVRRRNRMLLIIGLVALCAIAVGLTLYALRSNINLFFSPVQIAAGEAPLDHQLRAGGMVKDGSVERDGDSLEVRFVVTDFVDEVEVHYDGILPDLFRDGQGVVVVGKLTEGGWIAADEVLAKHDENYMPPEVAEALEKAGYSPADYRQAPEAAETR